MTVVFKLWADWIPLCGCNTGKQKSGFNLNSLLIFMTALFMSLGLVPVLRSWALTSGKLDIPGERKVHTQAIPRLGGIAIYLSFLFAGLAFIDGSREVRGILAGGLVVFTFGLIDDLYGLSAKVKLLGEISGVLITISVGHLYLINLGNLFGFGTVVLPQWFAGPFTVFAVVGVINAINLIDGLDGLSGGVSVIALVSFTLLAFHVGNTEVMFLCAALLGAVLGFLRYNTYPARIFMGDAGSLSVGFILGFLAILLTQSPAGGVSPMTPVVILGLPIIDALWVMFRRLMKDGRPFSPDMTHVHHKFLDLGVQHRFTVIIIYVISLLWAMVAIAGHERPGYYLLYSYLFISVISYTGLRYLINHRDKYPFFSKDSSVGLRESRIYMKIAAMADRVTPFLSLLLILYLLLTIASGLFEPENSLRAGVFYIPVLFLVWLLRKRLNRSFFKSVLYLSGLMMALVVDGAPQSKLLFSLTISQLEVSIFTLMLSLVIFKSFFRLDCELFVSLPEIAALATGGFVLVAFSQMPELSNMCYVPIRGGVIFLAINIVFFRHRTLPQQS